MKQEIKAEQIANLTERITMLENNMRRLERLLEAISKILNVHAEKEGYK